MEQLEPLRPLLARLIALAPEQLAAQDERGRTPLALAVYTGHVVAVTALANAAPADAVAPDFAQGQAWPWPARFTAQVQSQIILLLQKRGQ